eukprot:18428-Pelagomonas_calceolata.AAC.1
MLQPRQPLMIMTHHQNRAQSQQSNRKKERDRSSSRKDIDCPPFLPIGKRGRGVEQITEGIQALWAKQDDAIGVVCPTT